MIIATEKKGRDLYGLLFHYNLYKGKWGCFRNEDKGHYFNGTESTYPIGRGDTVEEAYKNYTK